MDANLAPVIRIGQLLDSPALVSIGVGRFAIDGEKWMTAVRPLALVDAHPFLQLQGDIVQLRPVLQDLVVLGTVWLEDFDGGACAALQTNTIFLLLLCCGSLPGLLQVLLA